MAESVMKQISVAKQGNQGQVLGSLLCIMLVIVLVLNSITEGLHGTTWTLEGQIDFAQINVKEVAFRMTSDTGVIINIRMSCQNGQGRIQADIGSSPFDDMADGCTPSDFWKWWDENEAAIKKILGKKQASAARATLKTYIR